MNTLVHQPSRRTRRIGVLLSSCIAISLLLPLAATAQSNLGNGFTYLGTIELLAGMADGAGADQSQILAFQASAGSGMATDILDTSASVTVVTAEELRRRNALNTEQVLQYTPAVNADFYGSDDRFDSFNIRGFLAYTYRDGLRLGSSDRGGPREEIYAFDRVEVIRGGNSTTFGISDPGGSVNFVSKTPRRGEYGEIFARYGSFGTTELGFDVGNELNEEGTLSFRLTGIGRRGSAEYDYSQNNENFLMGSVAWRPTDATSVIFTLDYLDREGVAGSGGHPLGTDLDRNEFFGEPDFNYRGIERTTATLKVGHDFGGGLTGGVTLRYSEEESDFGYAYIAYTSGPTTVARYFFANDRQANEFILHSDLQYETNFGAIESRTLAGYEYSESTATNTLWWAAAPDIDWTAPVYTGGIDINSTAPYASTRSDQVSHAVYLQQELSYNRFILSAGLRHDWIDRENYNILSDSLTSGDFSETTGRVGLTYKVASGLSVYGSYSQSVVPASFTVEPEYGEQFEIGAKYRPENDNALFSVAIYDLRKNNITRTNPITMLPETIGEVSVQGIDLEAKIEMFRNFSVTAGYTYMKSEIVENGTAGNEGNSLSLVPSQIASIWANYLLAGNGTRGDMTIGLGLRYTGAYWFDDANTLQGTDSLTLDAAFTYDVSENTQLAVNVSNLLDEKHVAFGGFGANFYNPGREINVTVRRVW